MVANVDGDRLKEIVLGIGPVDASLYGIARESANAAIVGELVQDGERLLATSIPALTQELFELFASQGNRLAYEGVYFERRRRLTTFGLLMLLYPERKDYLSALVAIVEAVLEENTWCLPAHMRGETLERGIDLFAAETGFALAELIVLAGDAIPIELRERIRVEVDRRLFKPYLTMGPYAWETADHNWAAVCAGSIGSAALLLERDGERLAEISGKVLGTLSCYLSGFGVDGACLEGVGYWNYGFGYFVYYADLLYRRSGGRIDLLADDKVRQIALFQQRCYLCGDRTANFSDTAERSPAHRGLSAYLVGRYASVEAPPESVYASLRDDHCARFAPALRDLFWVGGGYREDDARGGSAWSPGSWYLPDAKWLVSRHGSEYGQFGFAAKGGHNAEPHNHLDVGQFIVVAEGEPAFAADLGRGEYTAQYFGEGRYDYDCNGAQGHSLPVIGGRRQQPGRSYEALVLKAEPSREEDVLEQELAGTYDCPELASLVRRLAWRKAELPSLELIDEYKFGKPVGDIEELIISRCEPEVIMPGEIVLRGGRLNVIVSYDASLLTPSAERRTMSGHDGTEDVYYRISLKALVPDALGICIKIRFAFAASESAEQGADDARMA